MKPMLADKAATVTEAARRPCALEAKYDGHRILAHVTEDGVRLYARDGNCKSGVLPAVESELARFFPAGSWLDGEAVALNLADGRVDCIGTTQSVLGAAAGVGDSDAITYVVFDMLQHGEHDVRSLSYEKRRAGLELIFADIETDAIMLTPQFPANEQNYDALVGAGFEGVMVKALDAPYRAGRSTAWKKVKVVHTDDFVVIGHEPGRDVGALVFGYYDEDDRPVKVGTCKSKGFLDPAALIAERAVVEIEYAKKMPSGALRFPQFKHRRTDKHAGDIAA